MVTGTSYDIEDIKICEYPKSLAFIMGTKQYTYGKYKKDPCEGVINDERMFQANIEMCCQSIGTWRIKSHASSHQY